MHNDIISGDKYEGNFQAMNLTYHVLLTGDSCVNDRSMTHFLRVCAQTHGESELYRERNADIYSLSSSIQLQMDESNYLFRGKEL